LDFAARPGLRPSGAIVNTGYILGVNMQSIYVNNYRGFSETLIDLDRVNFFVGENSTGKTSIIDMVNVLSDVRFWFNYDLNSTDIDIGTFEDIKSKASKEKSFSIGIVEKNTNNDASTFYVVTYIEKDGVADINKYWVSTTFGIAYFTIDGTECKYKYKINEDGCKDIVQQYFETKKDTSFKYMNYKTETMREKNAFFYAIYEIQEKDKELKKIVNNNNIYFQRSGTTTTIAPIRAKPKSIYTGGRIINNSEGEHTPFIIRSLLSAEMDKTKPGELISIINDFGKESGLFDSLWVSSFGKKKIAPFELDIIKNEYFYKISTVGYGVSQILPIIVELLTKKYTSIYTIQQPEVHLHPRAQAAFGEFLFKIASTTNATFIIETHSDYLIDRFRYMQSQATKKIPSRVIYFKNINNQNSCEVIKIMENGKYQDNQPIAFREFFLNESLKSLEI
jgi:predicted ATP-dependent endonuclease of OLD family